MISLWHRYQREHPRALEFALALLPFADAVPGCMLGAAGSRAAPGWWLGALLVGAGCVVLPWRRGHPVVVTTLAAASAFAVCGLGYLPSALVLGPLIIALFTLADRRRPRVANSAAFATMAGVAGAAVAARPHETLALTVIMPIACLLLPLALGATARVKRAYLEAVQARAEFAERSREQEARQRVAEERMRIARELHDAVAHHLALANAQAGTAAHLAPTRPAQARQILAELTRTTSEALRELKATVGVLRENDESDAPLRPVPGLAQLAELTASLAAAGLKVAVSTQGTARALSPGVDLTAFRIVQEALTNVAKHAASTTANVRLDYGHDRLTITVTDDAAGSCDKDGASGPGRGDAASFTTSITPAPAPPQVSAPIATTAAGANTPGGGFGLIGMRERARSVGGRLQAGRRPEGGFQVTADLPLQP